MIDITLNRGYDSGESTIGILNTPQYFYVTLEDTFKAAKIKRETRIPSGRYEIKFREILSGKTKQYRKDYDWFVWHLELQNVPDFKYVYLHIGNYPKDTDGCILVGNLLDTRAKNFIGNSSLGFENFYEEISKYLNDGKNVFINIKDEW